MLPPAIRRCLLRLAIGSARGPRLAGSLRRDRACDNLIAKRFGYINRRSLVRLQAGDMDRPPKQMGQLEDLVPNSPSTDAFVRAGIPALVLAPMEGVADAPMRAFLSQQGGFTFCVSEFVRISQTVPGPRTFRERIPELLNNCRTPAGLPVQIQLLGGDPERLAQAAVVAVRAGAGGRPQFRLPRQDR